MESLVYKIRLLRGGIMDLELCNERLNYKKINDYGRCKECETKKHNVLLTENINDIQVSIIEHGDFFKGYEVVCEKDCEIGFTQTYKYIHQALEVFNVIATVLRMKSK